MNKNWFRYTVLLCLLCPSLMAQPFSIEGKVTSAQGPLVHASVLLAAINKATITDSVGHFIIQAIPAGHYELAVSFAGYETFITHITIKNKSPKLLHITLQPALNSLQDVTITDNYAERRKRESSMNIDVVNSQYIQKNLGGSLMQSLEKLPGIKAIGIGSGNSKPLIRGLGFNQVAVVENGMKHEGQQWGADHGLEIDQYAANRIEIIKGAASFMYGSDAIAGAIDVKPAPVPARHSFGATLDLTGKSNNQQLGGSLNIFGRKDKFFFDARITGMDYADLRIPADTVHVYSYAVALHENKLRNTAGKELNFHASAGWMGSHLQSVFYASRTYTKAGFFANAHGLEPRRVNTELHDRSARDIQLPYQNVTHYKIINKTNLRTGIHKFELQLGYQNNYRQEWNTYVNHGYMPAQYPTHSSIPITLERQYDKSVYSASLKDEFAINKHTITVGANAEHQNNQINGWSFLIPAFKQYTVGGFVYDKIQLQDNLLLQTAIRYDYGQIQLQQYNDWFTSDLITNEDTVKQYLQRSGNSSRTFSSVNWSVGMHYTPGNFSFKVNAGSSFRMPIAKELGANGVNYHYFRYEKGDSSLDAERSYQLDIGLGYNGSNWSVQLTPFFNYFPNFIYLNPTSQHDYFYGAGNQVFYYAQSKVMRYGGELQLRYDFLPKWTAGLAGEYLYNKQLSGDKKGYSLPFTPPPTLLFDISYKPSFKRHLTESYIGIDYRLAAAQNNIVPPERKTPGYHLLSFSAGTQVHYGKLPIRLSLQVQNVFNTRYLNHTSFYRLIGLPEAGRNIILSIKIPLFYKQQGNHPPQS